MKICSGARVNKIIDIRVKRIVFQKVHVHFCGVSLVEISLVLLRIETILRFLMTQIHTQINNQNVSKGIITTTSDFAPGVYTDTEVQRFMPYRLDLRPKRRLLEWLTEVASGKAGPHCADVDMRK